MADCTTEQWRFLETGVRDGHFNMAVDSVLAQKSVGTHPTLRIYGWKPHAISLGFHQNISELNFEKCLQDGIDVVRRPTGGRAIYHAHEVTYSVIIPESHALFHKGSMHIYNEISAALVKALIRAGVEPQLIKAGGADLDFGTYQQRFACFATSADYEVQYQNKKLVGSAQRRFKKSVLQHGSILLGTAHLRLLDYISPATNKDALTAKQQLNAKTICLETILDRSVTFHEIAKSLKFGFEKQFKITLFKDELTEAERNMVQEINQSYLALRRIAS